MTGRRGRNGRLGGFVLVTTLLLVSLLLALGVVFSIGAEQDHRFVRHELWMLQAEELARSGIAYARMHEVTGLGTDSPLVLTPFADPTQTVEITREGDALVVTGTVRDGDRIRARVALRAPLWDLRQVERVP